LGRRNLLQTSTGHRFEGIWWTASLSKKDFAWTRMNLVKGRDGKCAFERRQDFKLDVSTGFAGPTIPDDWSSRVDFKSDENHPRVLVQMGKRYDFRKKFEEAQIEGDPELAPHVMFRKLPPGNDAAALGFIGECGPLFLENMTRNPIIWIDLNDFWERHRRFVAIVRLYESLDDYEGLQKIILEIAEDLLILDAVAPAGLGMIPHTHKNLPFIRSVRIERPEHYKRLDQDGDPTWSHRSLRDHAREIICAELILQTFEGIRSGWKKVDEEEGMGFRPIRIVTSLWAAMWEMFGLESWRGYGWRSCKECAKYFYPSQVNSECCSPEHQALWSKRQYARKRRESEKLAASKRRRRTKKRT
jgi:hypothetical protein